MQSRSPFENFEQQFGSPYQDDEVIAEPTNEFMNARYLREEPAKHLPMQQKRIITILPKQSQPVKRIVSRPIQKVYRVKESPGSQQQTYRVVQPLVSDWTSSKIVYSNFFQMPSPSQATQRQIKQMYYNEPVQEIHMQPKSGPLVRQVSEEPRYVPIAPTVDIKAEPQVSLSSKHI